MTNLQRTNEYWQRRIYRLENELVAGIKVDELYNETYDKLLGDVEELYKRTKGGEPLTRTELYRYSKFLTFKNRLESESKLIGNYLHSEIEKAITEAYRAAGLAAKERLGEKSVWTVQNRRMAKACVERDWAGSNFSKRIWKNRQAMAAAVREGVIDCVINGRTRADFIDVLVKQFGDGNNPGAARSRAVTLTRTEIMHTLNTGAIETYKSEGVHFLEWDAEPDACGECLELASNNGGIYPIGEYPGAIAHPRCRCVPIPVEDDDPRVAGRLGKGDDATNYRGKYPQSTGENVLDISGESGIIREARVSLNASDPDVALNARHTGKGDPGAITHFGRPLNNRQKRLLDKLPPNPPKQKECNYVIVRKKEVSMRDLSALTAETGDEFLMLTKRQTRVILRGDYQQVALGDEVAAKWHSLGFKISGHTHPGTAINVKMPSGGDKNALRYFGQTRSVIYDSAGNFRVFFAEG